jgi:hypothetical protein
MPPIILVLTVTGPALFCIASFFLGWGSKPDESGSNPLKTVGWIAMAAGVIDLLSALYIVTRSTVPASTAVWPGGDAAAAANAPLLIGGLIGFYGLFFVSVGAAAFFGSDLRPVANLAVPVGLLPLAYWPVFSGGPGALFFHTTLIVWALTFLAVTAGVYGKIPGKVLGVILLVATLYTFFLPVVLLATTNALF